MIQDIHPHKFDNSFISGAKLHDNDYIFHFKENSLLLKKSSGKFEIPKKKEVSFFKEEGIYLFKLNNTNCFLVWDCMKPKADDFAYHEIKFRNPFSEKEIDWCAAVALQLKNWYSDNKFCGKCGAPTKIGTDERAICCPACVSVSYHTISPAIIVAVLCKDKILLARGPHFSEGFYSLVAGYVDIGESIEDAVAREVQEEVGLKIKNIRYLGSQPWAFSGSMMIGYAAEAEEGQIVQVDNKEITEANWYTMDTLPNHPPNRSISGEIIEKFINGEL